MPTYNYRCKTCDTRFDRVQSMSEPALTVCPSEGGPTSCQMPGKGEVTKVFGAVGITFKGSGFYKTDSRAGARSGDGNGSAGTSDRSDGSSKPAESSGSSGRDSGSSSSGRDSGSSSSGRDSGSSSSGKESAASGST